MSAAAARNLLALLWQAAAHAGDRAWLLIPEHPSRCDALAASLSFKGVAERAEAVAGALVARGASVGRHAVIIHDNEPEFVAAFFGSLAAGLIPVPLCPPYFMSRLDAYRERLEHTLADCAPQFILTSRTLADGAAAINWNGDVAVTATQDLDAPCSRPHTPKASDVAFVQYTSGSLSVPKGIMLSHESLLANLEGIRQRTAASSEEVGVSWLPLFHDMGLIGALLSTLLWQRPLVLLSPRTFLSGPHQWLWAISRFGATISPAPNFAYEICVRKIADHAIEGLDLSTWRVAFNAAETIHAQTLDAFTARFRPFGFQPTAWLPAYGLAEHCLAASLPSAGRTLRIDVVERAGLESLGVAGPARDGEGSRAVVGVGQPLPEHEVRIENEEGEAIPERHVGEICLRGPSVMRGILGQPEATREYFRGDWLHTGDRGYIADGELYVVGRQKDLIKRAGAGFDAADVESLVGVVPGMRRGAVVAVGVENEETGSEDLILLVESNVGDDGERRKLVARIIERVRERLGVAPDRVELVPPRTLPRTTSGKLRRAMCRSLAKEIIEGG